MVGPKPAAQELSGRVRFPAVAGMFYPADADTCRSQARSLVDQANLLSGDARFLGGIVPHAGWMCSGAIAGQTIAQLASQGPIDLVVVFGAIHMPYPTQAAVLDDHDRWALPGQVMEMPREIPRRLAEHEELFVFDDRFHVREHAVEVEIPLIRAAWNGAIVLPIQVPVNANAARIGIQTSKRIQQAGVSAVFLASSDLTHYGPAYDFAPCGLGPAGLDWARQNDNRLLEQVCAMNVEQIVPQVRQHQNACGGGAIAAMMAACRERGATRGVLLRHANSFETLAQTHPQPPDNAVGYAAVVVG